MSNKISHSIEDVESPVRVGHSNILRNGKRPQDLADADWITVIGSWRWSSRALWRFLSQLGPGISWNMFLSRSAPAAGCKRALAIWGLFGSPLGVSSGARFIPPFRVPFSAMLDALLDLPWLIGWFSLELFLFWLPLFWPGCCLTTEPSSTDCLAFSA